MRLAVIGFLILSSVAAAQGQTNMRAVSIDVTTGYLFTSNMTNVATTGRWNGDGGGWTNLNLASVTNDLTNLTVRVDALEADMTDVQSATDEFWLAYAYGTNWNAAPAHGITTTMTQTWSQAGVDASTATNALAGVLVTNAAGQVASPVNFTNTGAAWQGTWGPYSTGDLASAKADSAAGTNYIGTNTLNSQMADVRGQTNAYQLKSATSNNYLDGIWCDYCNTTQVCFNATNGFGSGYCADKYFFNAIAFTSTVSSLGYGSATPAIQYCYQTYSVCPTFQPYWSTNEPVYVPTWAGWYDPAFPSNRMVDAILSTNKATILPTFSRLTDGAYVALIILLVNGNPDGTFRPMTTLVSTVVPVSASRILYQIKGGDTDSSVQMQVGNPLYLGEASYTLPLSPAIYMFTAWISLDWTRTLLWYGLDANDNVFSVNIRVWSMLR